MHKKVETKKIINAIEARIRGRISNNSKFDLFNLKSNRKFKKRRIINDPADILVINFSLVILLAANKIAPIAPTDAASVGVAKPDKIEPKTAIIKKRGGKRTLKRFL